MTRDNHPISHQDDRFDVALTQAAIRRGLSNLHANQDLIEGVDIPRDRRRLTRPVLGIIHRSAIERRV
jgi:hypothetical protein